MLYGIDGVTGGDKMKIPPPPPSLRENLDLARFYSGYLLGSFFSGSIEELASPV
jgi:hypothetical protein